VNEAKQPLLRELAEETHRLRRISSKQSKEGLKVARVLFIVGAPDRAAVPDDQGHATTKPQDHAILGGYLSQSRSDVSGRRRIGICRSISRPAFVYSRTPFVTASDISATVSFSLVSDLLQLLVFSREGIVRQSRHMLQAMRRYSTNTNDIWILRAD
jgi:hypothetical protein